MSGHWGGALLRPCAAGLVFWVAACATSATNTLPQAKRDALRIDAIELSFAPDALISWDDGLGEFRSSGKPDTSEARRAFLEQKAMPHIKAALEAEIPPAFRGTDPARLRVTVRQLDVPPAIARIIIGGVPFTLKAEVQVIDARTGQTVVDAADFNGMLGSQGGLIGVAIEQLSPDPIDRVSRTFARALKGWLQTGQALVTG